MHLHDRLCRGGPFVRHPELVSLDVILSSGEADARDRTTDGNRENVCRTVYDADLKLDPYNCIRAAHPRKVPRTGFAAAQDDIT